MKATIYLILQIPRRRYTAESANATLHHCGCLAAGSRVIREIVRPHHVLRVAVTLWADLGVWVRSGNYGIV